MKSSYIVILALSILTASVILGGFYYATQVSKQKSIERQQELKLKDDKEIQEAKIDQEQKEYKAKRSNECYSIYEREREQFNNVDGHSYDAVEDKCVIRYTTDDYDDVDCDEVFGSVSSLKIECELGIFIKRY